MHSPSWFKTDEVLVVNAATCGINKDGHEQYLVDPTTGDRSDQIDDKLSEYVECVSRGTFPGPHVCYRKLDKLNESFIYVPKYYDEQTLEDFENFVSSRSDVSSIALGELIETGKIKLWYGHGSPSADQRVGTIPYIKVSDLRAGSVNINPTNLIPQSLAEQYWGANVSGLNAYDLISPERASKNIGEFCVLMPGQEQIVLTKEVICIRALDPPTFDQFYLMWALSLRLVRRQWDRIVFMQTNREDVGDRVLEIRIPLPANKAAADQYARPFRDYYLGLEALKSSFTSEIRRSAIDHHIF